MKGIILSTNSDLLTQLTTLNEDLTYLERGDVVPAGAFSLAIPMFFVGPQVSFKEEEVDRLCEVMRTKGLYIERLILQNVKVQNLALIKRIISSSDKPPEIDIVSLLPGVIERSMIEDNKTVIELDTPSSLLQRAEESDSEDLSKVPGLVGNLKWYDSSEDLI
jgi:hypothetical protein